MHRFAAVLLGSAFLPLALVLPSPAVALSLREALATAYATNPQIEAARANLRATDEEVAKANAGWRPNLSLNGTEGYQHIITDEPIHTDSDRNLVEGTAALTEPLFRGGRTVADIRRAKALVRAGQAQLANTEQSVLLDAATAYLDVVRDTADLEFRRGNADVLERQLAASTAQLNQGAITQTDVQQNQARLSAAQAAFSTAEGQLAASRARFERIIGRPPEMLEPMPALPNLPASLDEAVSKAISVAPALIAAQESSRAADYAIDQATSSLLPQVSLSLRYQYAKNSSIIGVLSPSVTQREASVFVQVTVPLYQGGAEYAAVRQAKELRSQSLANIADVDRQVRERAQAAWGAFTSAQASIASNEMAVTANQNAVMGVIEEQRAGERSILDILNAQQELLGGEIGLANARRDATVAAFQLLAAIGQLTARSLVLDVPLYDPLKHYESDSSAWFGLGPSAPPSPPSVDGPPPAAAPASLAPPRQTPPIAAEPLTASTLISGPLRTSEIPAQTAPAPSAAAQTAQITPAAPLHSQPKPTAAAEAAERPRAVPEKTNGAEPVSSHGAYYVQAGAFLSAARASAAAAALHSLGARVVPNENGRRPVYRVWIGPFASIQQTKAILAQAQSMGHPDLAIVTD